MEDDGGKLIMRAGIVLCSALLLVTHFGKWHDHVGDALFLLALFTLVIAALSD